MNIPTSDPTNTVVLTRDIWLGPSLVARRGSRATIVKRQRRVDSRAQRTMLVEVLDGPAAGTGAVQVDASEIAPAHAIEPGVPHADAWMQTFTGRRFYPLSPNPADIDPIDIAHSLANICRYGGHARRFLSVAEHCVMVSHAVAPEHAVWALLHDASEAYVGDMIRPLKHTDELTAYRLIEHRIQSAIATRFGLEQDMPLEVKLADTRALVNERRIAVTATDHSWGIEHLAPLDVKYKCWSPRVAKRKYLQRLRELGVK